jgi:hypothetical protein
MVGNARGSVWNSQEGVIVKQDQDLFVIANSFVFACTVLPPEVPARGLSGIWLSLAAARQTGTMC